MPKEELQGLDGEQQWGLEWLGKATDLAVQGTANRVMSIIGNPKFEIFRKNHNVRDLDYFMANATPELLYFISLLDEDKVEFIFPKRTDMREYISCFTAFLQWSTTQKMAQIMNGKDFNERRYFVDFWRLISSKNERDCLIKLFETYESSEIASLVNGYENIFDLITMQCWTYGKFTFFDLLIEIGVDWFLNNVRLGAKRLPDIFNWNIKRGFPKRSWTFDEIVEAIKKWEFNNK